MARESIKVMAAGDVAKKTGSSATKVETTYEVPAGRTLRLSRITVGYEHSVNEVRVEVLSRDGATDTMIAVGYASGTVSQFAVEGDIPEGELVVIRRVNGDPTDLHMTCTVEGILL